MPENLPAIDQDELLKAGLAFGCERLSLQIGRDQRRENLAKARGKVGLSQLPAGIIAQVSQLEFQEGVRQDAVLP